MLIEDEYLSRPKLSIAFGTFVLHIRVLCYCSCLYRSCNDDDDDAFSYTPGTSVLVLNNVQRSASYVCYAYSDATGTAVWTSAYVTVLQGLLTPSYDVCLSVCSV